MDGVDDRYADGRRLGRFGNRRLGGGFLESAEFLVCSSSSGFVDELDLMEDVEEDIVGVVSNGV